jgi:hypothetical protein
MESVPLSISSLIEDASFPKLSSYFSVSFKEEVTLARASLSIFFKIFET